jgi:MoaA/NifB/PqqE/SkfB family radical SAM enzyme
MNKLQVYKSVAMRPITAAQTLLRHRRTLEYLWKNDPKSFWNYVFVTYFIRGEDCGKGILDPVWKLTGKAPFLWDIELEVTTACYLRCRMCEHTYWPDKTYLNQHLKLEDFRKVIDSIPNLKWINLTGEGSAFLNPDFLNMVEYCKSRGIYVDFSHDFFRLDEDAMRRLIACHVDRIYWSVDGTTKNTYESIRVGSNFEVVKANIRRFVALKKEMGSPLPEICFRFCFFKDNVHEVVDIPYFLASIVEDVRDYGDEPSINIVALLEFEQTKDWAVEISPQDVAITNPRSQILGFTNYWSHVTHVEEEKAPADYCTFWSEPYVMITGHVVPCCAVLMSNKRPTLERLAFGNIHSQSLRDIWNTPYYKEFRKRIVNPRSPIPEVCVGCRAFNTLTRVRKYGVWKRENPN